MLEAVDAKKHCAACFIDLSKAFDTVDHSILRQRLYTIGMSDHAAGWFSNYLSNRKQCVQSDGLCSGFLNTVNSVPQGSVLGPIFIYIHYSQ